MYNALLHTKIFFDGIQNTKNSMSLKWYVYTSFIVLCIVNDAECEYDKGDDGEGDYYW